jgi:hypothetical protein
VLRRAIRAVRRGLDQRAQAWIRRRQGPDHDPIVLGRQRIYILPTGYGLAYGTMVFSMLLGGMNYNNNLGLGLTFVLASLGLVAMHHCHGTLAGLRVRLLEAEPAFVGQEVCYRLLLENAARVPRPALELEITPHRPPLGTADVPAAGAMQSDLRVPARRRGRLPLERFVIATQHPLGLAAVCRSSVSSSRRNIPSAWSARGLSFIRTTRRLRGRSRRDANARHR